MKTLYAIPRNWRLLCTSLALLLVLAVNHRAIPAYAQAAAPAEQAAVLWAGQDADGSVLKQKVSLEAISSFTQMDLAQPAAFPAGPVTALVTDHLPVKAVISPYWAFWLQRLATQPISPNAP